MTTVELATGEAIEVPEVELDERERAAWAWPEPLKPSEWAEKHRELREEEADLAGPWRNENAPYLRGIMDLAVKPGVERMAVEKAAQIGVSEACRILLGYWAHQDPGPVAVALPDKLKGEQIVADKIKPIFTKTPALQPLLTANAHDVKRSQITLANAFVLYLMWSGSAAAVASHPIKRAITDEVNKHAAWKGEEVSPVDSVDKRLRTYADALHLIPSTPTTRVGRVSLELDEANLHLYFLVPCPHCGTRQRLVFPRFELPERGEEETTQELAQRLVRDESVRYVCAGCEARLTERERRQMVQGGTWGTVGEDRVLADGRIENAEAVEAFSPGTRLGLQISALYCVWRSVTLGTIAAEWVRAKGDRRALFTFRTQTLGERWEDQQQRIKSNRFVAKTQAATVGEGLLPWWAARVAVTVDTQADYFWIVARAWGPGMLSQRVAHDWVESFDELKKWLAHPWPYASQWLPPRAASVLLIDTGGTAVGDERASRTQDVYHFAMRYQRRVRPIKGASKPRETGELYWPGKGVYSEGRSKGKGKELSLWMIDVHQAQDILAEQIEDTAAIPGEDGDEVVEQWQLNTRADAQYNQHMANMHRVVEQSGSELVERWVPVQDGVRVDYRHCEGYQIAAAYMLGIHRLPDLGAWQQQARQEAQEPRQPRVRKTVQREDGRPFSVLER